MAKPHFLYPDFVVVAAFLYESLLSNEYLCNYNYKISSIATNNSQFKQLHVLLHFNIFSM